MPEHKHEPIYYLLGVPLRSGSLYPEIEHMTSTHGNKMRSN